jgi:glycerate kinase
MAHAIQHGATRLIVGVGGSASTDGGAGALQALGIGLLDSTGQAIGHGGLALADLAQVIPNPQLASISLDVLCDVDHLPLGPTGSAAVFGPQKGATPTQVTLLDANLTHFFGLIAAQGGRDVRQMAGAGAAGALAGGLAALAGAQLVPGAQTILQSLGYPDLIAQCDLVITGEGRLDEQTEHGKGPAVIAQFAAQRSIPVIALAGQIPDSALPQFQAMFSLLPRPSTLAESQAHASDWLTQLAYQVGQTLSVGQLVRPPVCQDKTSATNP